MNKAQVRVIVAGAGIVGCVQSLLLARAGYQVKLVDAGAPSGVDDTGLNVRSVALSYRSMELLSTQKLWPADAACPIESVHVTERGKFGAMRLDATDLNVPALGFVVQNNLLENFLMDCVQDEANIELLRPASAELKYNTTSSVSVEINNLEQVTVEEAALLIAADGTQSTLRASLGIDADKTDYEQHAIVANLQCSRDHQNVAYERFTQNGPLALLPLADNQVAMVFTASSTDAKVLVNESDDSFLARLQRRFGGKLGRFEAVGQRAMFPLALVESTVQTRDRAVLIGNSARTVHPVAGQGLNLALRDVFELGSQLAQISGDPDALPATLAGFSKLRHSDQRTVVRQTDWLARVFRGRPWPLSVPLGFFRTTSMLLLDSTPLLRTKFGELNAGLNIPVSNYVPVAPVNSDS